MLETLKTGAIVLVAVVLGQIVAPFIVPLIHGDSGAGTVVRDDDGEEVDPRSLSPALYTPLDPPLLANFVDETGSTRYLQLGLQAMAREQAVIDAVRTHAPALRNAFLLLITSQDYAQIVTREGKERLREEMLVEARTILARNTGLDGIEALYFTSFIIQ